jgi:DNA-binding transcriptional LysR family regulator
MPPPIPGYTLTKQQMNHPAMRFDLNLIRAFVAIHETRSVTQAAERLNLTQPTISHSLARLREAYGDRLFSRGTAGLVPTAVAERLYEQLSVALHAIEGTLDAHAAFDPLMSTRRFRIALSDIGSLFFTPPLLRRFQTIAPRIQVEFVQLSDSLQDDLARGTLDLAIGNLPSLHANSRNALLFHERYVCLMADNHPGVGESMDLEAFSHARHVMVSSPSSGHALVDGVLAERGLQRNVVALVPQFSVLPSLLEDSDLVVVLPSRVAQLYARERRLRTVELPVPIAGFEVRLHWHARQDSAPAHRWLREEVMRDLSGL